MGRWFTATLLGSGAFLIAFLVMFSLMRNGPPTWSPPQAPAVEEQASITDPVAVTAFTEIVIKQGFNCPRVVSLIKSKHQTERGQPFMVACSGGFFYQVTVQPRGTAMVEVWK